MANIIAKNVFPGLEQRCFRSIATNAKFILPLSLNGMNFSEFGGTVLYYCLWARTFNGS